MKTKEHRILLAGYGGQGIVLAGNLIARACIFENKNVTGMVAYGAEMRGGTANATVIISDNEIGSPVVEQANIGLFFNQPSLDKFEPSLVHGSKVVLNTSMIEVMPKRRDLEITTIEATSIADELGNMKIANIVLLGAFVKGLGLLKPESLESAIDELFSEKNKSMAEINKAAFRKGLECAK
jgi:2-oxoglutarate ferredoxin oxidoreductase subunit gamma